MSRATRGTKAVELLERATRGPSIDIHPAEFSALGITAEQASKIADHYSTRYRGWSESWLLPLLHDLVPELRGQAAVTDAIARAARTAGRKAG